VRSRAETASYWRDAGTLDAYFGANIDLTDVVPELDVYDREWPPQKAMQRGNGLCVFRQPGMDQKSRSPFLLEKAPF
jgi:hypothetical protein